MQAAATASAPAPAPAPTSTTLEEYVEAISTCDTIENLNRWGKTVSDDKTLGAEDRKKLKAIAGKRAKELAESMAREAAQLGGEVE